MTRTVLRAHYASGRCKEYQVSNETAAEVGNILSGAKTGAAVLWLKEARAFIQLETVEELCFITREEGMEVI